MNVVTVSRFQYQPLSSPTGFRIVELLPGRDDEPIKTHMRNVTQNDKDPGLVPYEALSYVWGDPTDQTPIECDSAFIDIPKTLYSAFQHLRWKDRHRVLWADSLCINQQDVLEKSIQVQLMGTIYRNADQIIMWQGEETEDTRDALASFARLCESIANQDNNKDWQNFLDRVRRAWPLMTNAGAEAFDVINEVDPTLFQGKKSDWGAIVALLSRPYFRRRWIAQEIILARKAVLVCGYQILDWGCICQHSRVLQQWRKIGWHLLRLTDNQRELEFSWENLIYMADSSNANKFLHSQGPKMVQSLYDALLAMTSLQCYDPRDRLFSLLSIAPDVDLSVDTEVAPDYIASEHEILHRLAIWIIVRKRHTSYLSFAAQRTPGSEEARQVLPSWVPLNLGKTMTWPSLQYRITRGLMSLHVEGRNESPMKGPIELSKDRQTITMNGKIIDRVESCSRFSLSDMIDNPPEERIAWIAAADERFVIEYGLQGLQDLDLAFWVRECLSVQGGGKHHWGKTACSDHFVNYICETLIVFTKTSGIPHDERRLLIRGYMKYLSDLTRWQDYESYILEQRHAKYQQVYDDLVGLAIQHKLCKTKKNIMGLVMGGVRPEDLVCVLDGTQVPWIIRPSGTDTYILIGECGLESLLHGEAFQDCEIPEQMIALI